LLRQPEINVNIPNNDGNIPLHYLVRRNFLPSQAPPTQIKRSMTKTSADVQIDYSLEHQSPKYPWTEEIRRESSWNFPLHVLLLMIEKGAIVNYANSFGETALHSSCLRGYLIVAKTLLCAGADPNAITKDGQTALHYAVGVGNFALVSLLLDYGANPKIRSKHGSSFDIAMSYDLVEIAEIIRDALKKQAAKTLLIGQQRQWGPETIQKNGTATPALRPLPSGSDSASASPVVRTTRPQQTNFSEPRNETIKKIDSKQPTSFLSMPANSNTSIESIFVPLISSAKHRLLPNNSPPNRKKAIELGRIRPNSPTITSNPQIKAGHQVSYARNRTTTTIGTSLSSSGETPTSSNWIQAVNVSRNLTNHHNDPTHKPQANAAPVAHPSSPQTLNLIRYASKSASSIHQLPN